MKGKQNKNSTLSSRQVLNVSIKIPEQKLETVKCCVLLSQRKVLHLINTGDSFSKKMPKLNSHRNTYTKKNKKKQVNFLFSTQAEQSGCIRVALQKCLSSEKLIPILMAIFLYKILLIFQPNYIYKKNLHFSASIQMIRLLGC